MRSTHLAAHMRSHMDESQKPFTCSYPGCSKRFWTHQHLHRHAVSCHASDGSQGVPAADATAVVGGVSGLYSCEQCDMLFSKRKYLRQHVRVAHADFAGNAALPYVCEICNKRFPTNSKRKQHARVHETYRYQCVLPHEHPAPPGHGPYEVNDELGAWAFATWTDLQAHLRQYHPPQCDVCGRTYSSREGLRRHMRLHGTSEEHACPWNGCHRPFGSRSALNAHISRVHESEKPFVCEQCGQRFGYKHLLERHARAHRESEANTLKSATNHTPCTSHPHLALLVGAGRKRARRERVLPCPWPLLCRDTEADVWPHGSPASDDAATGVVSPRDSSEMSTVADSASCTRRFARLYDVQRHLTSVHGLSLTYDELCMLLPDEALAQLPSHSKRARSENVL